MLFSLLDEFQKFLRGWLWNLLAPLGNGVVEVVVPLPPLTDAFLHDSPQSNLLLVVAETVVEVLQFLLGQLPVTADLGSVPNVPCGSHHVLVDFRSCVVETVPQEAFPLEGPLEFATAEVLASLVPLLADPSDVLWSPVVVLVSRTVDRKVLSHEGHVAEHVLLEHPD